jgi:hypothetical protein
MMEIVPEHMKDNLLPRARTKHLALCFRQGSWRIKYVPEIGDCPPGEGVLDHMPGGLESSDQLGCRMHRLSRLLLLPVHEGSYLGTALSHP